MIKQVVVAPDMPHEISISQRDHQKAVMAFVAEVAAKENLHYGVLKHTRIGWSFEFQLPGETKISRQQSAKLADLLAGITVDCIVVVWDSGWRRVKNAQYIPQKVTIYPGDT